MREWFLIAELEGMAGLPSTVRGIRKLAERDGWQCRRRATGKGYEYHLNSLPATTQAALLTAYPDTPLGSPEPPVANREPPSTHPATVSFSYDRDALWAHYERTGGAAQVKAKRRLVLLDQVERLVDGGTPRGQAFAAVALANGEPVKTLLGWYHGTPGRPGVKLYERSDWLAALMPGYTGRTVTTACDAAAWDYFTADYLRLERPGLNACYSRLKQAAKAQGWTIPSSPRTLQRRLEKEVPPAVRVLKREGELALQRLYPAQQRSVADLPALGWINGDGYQHNVFVAWPDGSIARPKTWFWQDVRTRKQLAYRVDMTEHTDLIRLSFGDLIERYGIPDDVTIDNTTAAANKWMTGGIPYRNRFKVRRDDVLGLFPQLSVTVHWTSLTRNAGGKNVGHGQAKPVERAFGIGGLGEYVDKHPAFAGAWCGNDPQSKPENYASRAVSLDAFLGVLGDAIAAWNAQPGRRTQACGGVLSFDQAFEASYRAALVRKPTAAQRRLWLLPAEAVRVQRDGSIALDAGSSPGTLRNRYWSEALLAHVGTKIVARFDPDALHADVHAYTLAGAYIGPCDCHAPVGFGDTQTGREHARARTQWKRAVRDQARAAQRMTAIEAAALLPGVEQPEPPETKVVRLFRPAVSGNTALAGDDDELEANFSAAVRQLRQAKDDGL